METGLREKPTLHGRRVILRPIVAGDAEAVYESLQDEETLRLTGTQSTFTRPQIEAWCKYLETAEGRIDLGVVAVDGGELVGEAVLNDIDPRNRRAAFRIALTSSRAGRGYGSEAAYLLLDHGFRVLGLNRISLEVYSFNARAIHVYEKLGFRHEGRLREVLYQGGEFQDALVMAVLRREWAERWWGPEGRAIPVCY